MDNGAVIRFLLKGEGVRFIQADRLPSLGFKDGIIRIVLLIKSSLFIGKEQMGFILLKAALISYKEFSVLPNYPEENRAFRESPSYFRELTDSSFDCESWETAMTEEEIPTERNCVHPFDKNGICIAELVIVNLMCVCGGGEGGDDDSYHNSYVLMLRYSPSIELHVIQLVDMVPKNSPISNSSSGKRLLDTSFSIAPYFYPIHDEKYTYRH